MVPCPILETVGVTCMMYFAGRDASKIGKAKRRY